MSRGIIAAVAEDGVIGVDGQLPWHYSGDLRRFKKLTLGGTVIMGRLTWESLPRKPLGGRRNLVITSGSIGGVECFPTIEAALATCEGEVWFIGGARIFDEAMSYADVIDLTYVPDRIAGENVVRFPPIDEASWEAVPLETDPEEPRLKRRVYRRRKAETE